MTVDSPDDFISRFKDLEMDSAVLLFKGSRGLKMEKLLSALLDAFSEERTS
jgi:UDP-N-acetylmuramyl pentapeptide synthase